MSNATYKRKSLFWGLQFHRVRAHDNPGEEHGSRQASMALEMYLRAYNKDDTVTANWEQHGLLKSQSPLLVAHLLQGVECGGLKENSSLRAICLNIWSPVDGTV